MLLKYKKLIVAITVMFFTFGPVGKPAHAWVPLVMGGIWAAGSLATWIEASFWVHVAAVGGYMWYHSRGSNQKKVDPNGNIYRDSQVTWVDLKDGHPVGKTGEIIGKVKYDNVKNKVESNPSKYPNLSEALKGQAPLIDANKNVGDIVSVPGVGTRRIVSIHKYNPYCGAIPGTYLLPIFSTYLCARWWSYLSNWNCVWSMHRLHI